METSAWSAIRMATAGVLLAVVACGGGDDDAGSSSVVETPDPTGWTWTLVELNGEPLIENTVIDMTVTQAEVSGTGGCNQYMGTAAFDGTNLTIGPELGRTLMMCDDGITAQEDAYLAALASVESFDIVDDDLILMDGDGTVVARYTP